MTKNTIRLCFNFNVKMYPKQIFTQTMKIQDIVDNKVNQSKPEKLRQNYSADFD